MEYTFEGDVGRPGADGGLRTGKGVRAHVDNGPERVEERGAAYLIRASANPELLSPVNGDLCAWSLTERDVLPTPPPLAWEIVPASPAL